jgi:hypothetical protein
MTDEATQEVAQVPHELIKQMEPLFKKALKSIIDLPDVQQLIADDGGANAFFFASIFLLVKMAAAVAASFNVAEQDFVSFAWASYLKAAEEIGECKGSVERAN